MEINYRRLIFKAIGVILLFIPFTLWVMWLFTPKKPMNILIVDKTVADKKVQEHQAFSWILKNQKYVKPDKHFYNPKKDYMGFFPVNKNKFEIRDVKNYSDRQIDSISNMLDMIYFADTYGIYKNQWDNNLSRQNIIEKIYGGFDENEYTLLEKVYTQKKLVIAEFNFVATPTSPKIRKQVEDLVNMKWSGWKLRYFNSLDTLANPEFPNWIVQLFKLQNKGTWPFRHSGIVFVHEDERICILEDSVHLDVSIPMIYTSAYGLNKYKLPEKIPYPYWADIILPTDSAYKLVANYKIHANKKGRRILDECNIPVNFPAIAELAGEKNFYYFAGDFCDNDIPFSIVRFKWADWLGRKFTDVQKVTDRNLFLWNYYIPLVQQIMKDYYQSQLNSNIGKSPPANLPPR